MIKSVKKLICTTLFSALTAAASPGFAIDYFGYFAIAGGTDHQSEVADHSNVVWIHNPTSTADAQNALNAAIQSGKKAIVSLTPVFQQGNGNFNPNWSTNWANWVNALAPYSSTIVAFYPMDEPSSSRISATNSNVMVSAVRAAFPGKPVAAIYAYRVNTSNVGMFDWVGIDCYSHGAFNCDGTDYTKAYANMRALLRADQRTVLVPQAGLPTSRDGCCIDALKAEAKRFHQLAYGDSKVIGIFPFIWQSFTDSQNSWYGLEHYAALKPVWQQVGLATGSHWSFPSDVRPVYRFFNYTNAEHFFTTDAVEGINASRTINFTFESIGFNVYATQTGGMAPLYRCTTSWDHFVSRDPACESYTLEGIYGYVQTTQVSGTIPLYRFFNPNYGRHLETTNYAEGTAPFVYETTLGYVPNTVMPSVGC